MEYSSCHPALQIDRKTLFRSHLWSEARIAVVLAQKLHVSNNQDFSH